MHWLLNTLRDAAAPLVRLVTPHRRSRACSQRRIRFEPLEPRLAMAGVSADFLVDLSLSITKPDGSPATSLSPGDEFLLRVTAEDLREDPRGVFAAYLDVEWDSSLALVTGPIRYNEPFNNGKGKDADISRPGLLNEVGAFSGGAELGAGQFEVFVVPMRVTGRGDLVFTASPADVKPNNDVLIYRENGGIPLSTVHYGAAIISLAGGTFLASPDTFRVSEDTANQTLTPLANDANLDQNQNVLTISAVGTPTHGGQVVLAPDGKSLRYTPAANFSGTESFTYTARNQHGETHIAPITIEVLSVNDPPTARGDLFSVPANSSANFLAVLANDSIQPDSGELLHMVAAGRGNHGGVVVIQGTSLAYTPPANFSGPETFTYTISDRASGGLRAQATVTIIVTPPVAVPDTIVISDPAEPTQLDVLKNDIQALPGSSPGSDLTIVSVTQPNSGTVSVAPDGKSLIFDGRGTLRLTTQTIVYAVADSLGQTHSASVTLSLVAPTILEPGFRLDGDTLHVGGSAAADNVTLTFKAGSVRLNGRLGGTPISDTHSLRGVRRLVVHLDDGNDTLAVRGAANRPVIALGGNGNDALSAGNTSAVLVGGEGDDTLRGGGKRDVLIGGLGHDRIFGAAAHDWMVGGHTAYDVDADALTAIAAEWNSRRTVATRLENLRTGNTPALQNLSIALQDQLTLFEDGDLQRLFKGRRGRN